MADDKDGGRNAPAVELPQHSLSKNAELGDLNASGHIQQLDRQFGALSIIAVGAVVGNVWAATGGSIVSIL